MFGLMRHRRVPSLLSQGRDHPGARPRRATDISNTTALGERLAATLNTDLCSQGCLFGMVDNQTGSMTCTDLTFTGPVYQFVYPGDDGCTAAFASFAGSYLTSVYLVGNIYTPPDTLISAVVALPRISTLGMIGLATPWSTAMAAANMIGTKLAVLVLQQLQGQQLRPDEFAKLTSLEELLISECRGIDPLPAGLIDPLPRLRQLFLADNG